MSEAKNLFSVLRQSADPEAVDAIEKLVQDAPDRALCRINVLDFAAKTGLDEERAIAAFLHAARLGIFELAWNVLCPGCGGVLDSSTTLKSVDKDEYACAWCASGYTPILDEIVEVTFTVNRRVRRISAHDPSELPFNEYFRQVFWGSGIDVPDNFEDLIQEIVLESVELPPREKALLSLQLPAEFVIILDPVTHATRFLDVKGEPTRERQNLTLVLDKLHTPTETVELRPGPLRLSLENHTDSRVLPALWVANDKLHGLLARRKPFLTAKRLLTNQVFRDIYGTDTIDVDQRLKITPADPQSWQHPGVGTVIERQAQRPRTQLHGFGGRTHLVKDEREALAFARRLALDVEELRCMRHRVEEDREFRRQMQRKLGLLTRRELDRVERHFRDQPIEVVRKING